ncbi:MAG: cellulase family glycosylhydrolase [Bacteroidales bacterium]
MNYTMRTMLAVLIISLASCGNPAENSGEFEKFEVQRGTNIAHFLSQSNNRGAEREAFFTKADVETIAALGFDHIRMPIDEEQMWNEEMEKNADAFELLHNSIKWSHDAGLRVIIDLHILRSHHFNEGEKPLWTERAEQEKFFDLWRDLSGELAGYPVGQVAYELMNEAVADDPEQWNELLNEAYSVIRELEPDRVIVIGSNRWQSANTFHQLRIPGNDPNILLSFHFYNPMALTHYRASWSGVYDYEGPVQYPGEVIKEEDLEGYPEKFKQQMKWSSGYYTIDTLKKMMQEPLEFARKNNLNLYCGEFGVYKPAPREDALRWYDDMITAMEEYGIGWGNWCYKGSFGIFNEEGSVDQELMDIFFQNKEN